MYVITLRDGKLEKKYIVCLLKWVSYEPCNIQRFADLQWLSFTPFPSKWAKYL
jgi:hypothetical protein